MGKVNGKVVVLSLIGIGFMVMIFWIHWTFIIGAALASWMGWKILFEKK